MFFLIGKTWVFNGRHVLQQPCLQNQIKFYCVRSISQSYYDILRLPQTCSSKEVRDAFINLSKKYHPDKHLNDPSMHERFVKIKEAYSVLINPTSRRDYDLTLHHKRELEAPTRFYYDSRGAYYTTKKQQQWTSSTNSGYTHNTSTGPGDHADTNFFYSFREGAHNKANEGDSKSYYGIRGIKRVSNAMVLTILLILSTFGIMIQYYALRNHASRSRKHMLEKSRKYSMMHALAKEKARLYGNKHQIDVLKRTLLTTFDLKEADAAAVVVETLGGTEKIVEADKITQNEATPNGTSQNVNGPVRSDIKCEKCNKTKRT